VSFFVDHYEVLQVSPNADQETIQRVFRLLAQRFHPDNRDTGDDTAFKEVLTAYRVLSDPEQRAAFDVEHRSARRLTWRIFDQNQTCHGVEAEKKKRQGILSLLYTKRLNQPEEPGVTMRELEDLLGCPREHLEFSLWYLKEHQWITRGDNGRHVITAKGVDVVEDEGDLAVYDRQHLLPAPQHASEMQEVAWS
jgi:curved DNA-binding protein CbpA